MSTYSFWKKTQIYQNWPKFKIRLVVGNGIRSAKIRPEGPVNPLESACKIFWPHLKNSWKKSKKTYPQKPPFFLGGVVSCCLRFQDFLQLNRFSIISFIFWLFMQHTKKKFHRLITFCYFLDFFQFFLYKKSIIWSKWPYKKLSLGVSK